MANYTKKAILETFQAMLVELPFNKITVSALVERCGISSNTFYYHFRDIYDLLETWLSAKEEKYGLQEGEDPADWAALMAQVLKLMQSNSRLIYHIADAVPKERLEDYVFGRVQKQFYQLAQRHVGGAEVSEDFVRHLGEFYCCTLLGYAQKFLWSHMQTDVDKSVQQLKNTFYGITEYMIAEEQNRMRQAHED